jgi:hypothetical protein
MKRREVSLTLDDGHEVDPPHTECDGRNDLIFVPDSDTGSLH